MRNIVCCVGVQLRRCISPEAQPAFVSFEQTYVVLVSEKTFWGNEKHEKGKILPQKGIFPALTEQPALLL